MLSTRSLRRAAPSLATMGMAKIPHNRHQCPQPRRKAYRNEQETFASLVSFIFPTGHSAARRRIKKDKVSCQFTSLVVNLLRKQTDALTTDYTIHWRPCLNTIPPPRAAVLPTSFYIVRKPEYKTQEFSTNCLNVNVAWFFNYALRRFPSCCPQQPAVTGIPNPVIRLGGGFQRPKMPERVTAG